MVDSVTDACPPAWHVYPGRDKVFEDIAREEEVVGIRFKELPLLEVYYDDLDYGAPSWAVQQAYADWASKTAVNDQTQLWPNGGGICPGLN